MAGGRLHRHLDARDCRCGLQASRPADRRGQQGRRRRHGRPCNDGGGVEARRLHHLADPDHRVPAAADARGVLESGQGFQLHHPSHGLHLRRHHPCRFAVQDLEGRRRFRQGQSRQGDLCDARRRHLAACRHGADRRHGRRQADPGAVQGRRGDQCRGARPAYHAAGRLHRLAAAGRCRQAASVDGVDREALAEFSGRADVEGTRLSDGL